MEYKDFSGETACHGNEERHVLVISVSYECIVRMATSRQKESTGKVARRKILKLLSASLWRIYKEIFVGQIL